MNSWKKLKNVFPKSKNAITSRLTFVAKQKLLATVTLVFMLGGSFGLAVQDPSCRNAFFGLSSNVCALLIRVIYDSPSKK